MLNVVVIYTFIALTLLGFLFSNKKLNRIFFYFNVILNLFINIFTQSSPLLLISILFIILVEVFPLTEEKDMYRSTRSSKNRLFLSFMITVFFLLFVFIPYNELIVTFDIVSTGENSQILILFILVIYLISRKDGKNGKIGHH